MALAYGKASPQDMLAKAERDLARLESAESTQNQDGMSDALFDLAVALTSVKDWLKEHPGASFSPSSIESYVAQSAALSSFQDIANGGKHRVIRKYATRTSDVTASVASAVSIAVLTPESKISGNPVPTPAYPRLKIIRTDGSRHRATELGQAAIGEWRAFIAQHAVTS